MPHPLLSAIEKFSQLALEQAQTAEQRSALIQAIDQMRAFGKAMDVEQGEEKFTRNVEDWYRASLKVLCMFALVVRYDPDMIIDDFKNEMMAMYVWLGKMTQAIQGQTVPANPKDGDTIQ